MSRSVATVLVVDRDPAVCGLLERVLTQHGHEVLRASGPAEALALIGSHSPVLVFLELDLLAGAGVRLLEEIRTTVEPRTQVVALMGSLGTDLEVTARQLGVTDFVSKVAAARELTRSGAGPTDEGGTITAGQLKSEKILVVDDEPGIVRLLAEFLTLRGHHVSTAENGAAALALVERTSPDLILLDLYMPVMNGVEVFHGGPGPFPNPGFQESISAGAFVGHGVKRLVHIASPIDQVGAGIDHSETGPVCGAALLRREGEQRLAGVAVDEHLHVVAQAAAEPEPRFVPHGELTRGAGVSRAPPR
jgi:DNA-binding response OmpR family regulator